MTVLEGLAAGTIDLAFRRWSKQNVRQGDVMRLEAGVIEVGSVETVDPATITDADARRSGADSANAVRGTLRGSADAPVYRIHLRYLGPDPRRALSAAAELSEKDFEAIRKRLSKMDRRRPWTHETLRIIAGNPGRRAQELADLLGREKEPLKVDIRKLKNLGLTLSLEVGYRISPRGAAYLRLSEDPGRTR
ncbi:hypothetical protein DL991_11910 [Amycolatopsis sp. WAC 01375]|uniref:hypothetical protein n=1 Tax=Amycolatopsis sp. WAC 01375 TaxID=2203194 RepID=UPI000F7B1FA2|nr:hypothetical protein [Amycolatopsis sp. WAC 01375]RSM80287.1 hypothetical protein DL991_11910 [Amycolatopsis sp. WAC 01375]